MDDFQKYLRKLRGSRAFAAAFDKKRAEAEVAFQIRRLRESKGWSQKDLAERVEAASRRSRRSNRRATSATRCRSCAVLRTSSTRTLSSRSFQEKLHNPSAFPLALSTRPPEASQRPEGRDSLYSRLSKSQSASRCDKRFGRKRVRHQ